MCFSLVPGCSGVLWYHSLPVCRHRRPSDARPLLLADGSLRAGEHELAPERRRWAIRLHHHALAGLAELTQRARERQRESLDLGLLLEVVELAELDADLL